MELIKLLIDPSSFKLSMIFTAFFVGLFLFVMTRNYIKLRKEKWDIDLLDGEQPVDELEVEGGIRKTRSTLTNLRIMQMGLSWFLSKRKFHSIALEDVHSV